MKLIVKFLVFISNKLKKLAINLCDHGGHKYPNCYTCQGFGSSLYIRYPKKKEKVNE